MKCQSSFSGKDKIKYHKSSSAEYAQSVVKVNVYLDKIILSHLGNYLSTDQTVKMLKNMGKPTIFHM